MAYTLLPYVQEPPGIPALYAIQEAPGLLFHDDLEHLLCLGTFDLMLWKESWATPYSLSADLKALFLTDFFEEFMGDLEKDTDAIAGFSFCIFTCTMLQILYDLKSICNSIMCFLSFYINNGSDTAVIMFKFRAVEALLLISLTSLIFLILSLQLLLPSFFINCRLHKSTEQWMCMVRAGFEFRMSLCSYKERMSGNFDHLNDMSIRGSSYDGHSLFT